MNKPSFFSKLGDSFMGFARDAFSKEGKKALAIAPIQANMNAMRYDPIKGTPKPTKVSFAQLRQIAKVDSLIRICVNVIKKEVSQAKWRIVPKPGVEPDEAKLQSINALFIMLNPNSESLRVLLDRILEDLLVLDAGVVEKVHNAKGELMELNSVDGATIRPRFNKLGEYDPDKAYVQVVNNEVVAEFKQDEIIYMMSNPQNELDAYGYGMSPIESILMTVQASLNAQVYNAKTFSADNVPPGMLDLGGMSNEEAQQFVALWNATVIGGNQRMKFVWGSDNPKKYIPFQNGSHKDMQYVEYLDWLSRLKLAAYGLSGMDANITQDVNRACYDEETETLTENGWKKWYEVSEGEKIATYNPQNQKLEYHLPMNKYVYDVNEELNYFHNTNVNIAVTDEHKMWSKEFRGSEYCKVDAEKIPWARFSFVDSIKGFDGVEMGHFVLPPVSKESWKGSGNSETVLLMDDWLEFLGYFISEGGLAVKDILEHKRYHLTLSQNDGEVARRMEGVLNRLGFSYDSCIDKNGCIRFNVYGKQLCMWLLENCGGYCKEKKIPRQFMGLSVRQLSILWKALMDGDGTFDSRENRTSCTYYSTSEELCSNVQELSYKLGYRAKLRVHYGAHENKSRAYRVLICKAQGDGYGVQKDHITRKLYKGKVYCFEVPNHLFVTRRDGDITIQGNTAQVQESLTTSRGVQSTKNLVEEYFNREIMIPQGYGDYEFKFEEATNLEDRRKQAEIDKIYIEQGVISPEDVSEREGIEPVEEDEFEDDAGSSAPSPNPEDNRDDMSDVQQIDNLDKSAKKSFKKKAKKYYPPIYG